MDFRLEEEQVMLTDAIKRLAQEQMRKVYRDADEDGVMPASVVQAGWKMGLLPTTIPEEFGGFGDYSMVTNILAIEEFAWGDLATTIAIMAPNLVAVPLMLAGTSAQKETWLPRFCEENPPYFTAALTEPRVQFDPRNLKTTAQKEGDEYILNGAKSMVSLAGGAELILVYASENGKTESFLLSGEAAGLTMGAREKLMGVKALPTYSLTLENVKVPASAKLGGDEGIDFDLILNHSRVALAAAAVGLARASFEYAKEYAKTRIQFGEPIAYRQSIAFMLAEMAIDIDAARLLVWEAAWLLDKGQDATQAATVMKYALDDLVLSVADRGLQVLGGHGYIREHPVELWFRNARGFASFDGMMMV